MAASATQVLKKSLLLALRSDDVTLIRSILDSQGWPSYSKWSDYELLLKAVQRGCKRVALLLLEKGARVFKRTGVNSPLHEAVTRLGWISVVKLILDRGGRTDDVNKRGDTPVHVAFAHRKSTEMMDLLLRALLRDRAVDVVNGDGLSLLHIACTRPAGKVVRAILENGADVGLQVPVTSSSIYAGYTPLHFAVEFGQYEVVELLLEQYDADVYEQNADGSTPLHLAAERRDVAMIDLILRYDDRCADFCNNAGLSHFMAACAGSNSSVVEDYLRFASYRSWSEPSTLVTSQVEDRTNYPIAGYTALHFAAEFGRVDSAKLLLRLGARCCATTTNNVTPFALACKYNHVDVCALLTQCCDVSSQLLWEKRIFKTEIHEGSAFYAESRADSVIGNESTLTSSSIMSSASDDYVEPFITDPLNVCVNMRRVFEKNDAHFRLQRPRVLDFCDDIDDGSMDFSGDHLRCDYGAWSNREDLIADYSNIEIPKNIELDFFEPLDNVDLDVGHRVASTPVKTCRSFNNSANVKFSFSESLDEATNLEKSNVDDELFFDRLFEEYLKEKDKSGDDDLETSLASDLDPLAEPLSDWELIARQLDDTDYTDDDELDKTLEVSSTSSDSEFFEDETKLSTCSDGSSTIAVSSGYDSDSSIKNFGEMNRSDDDSDSSTCSSSEREIEVTFIEVERFDVNQSKYVGIVEISEMNRDSSGASGFCAALGIASDEHLSDLVDAPCLTITPEESQFVVDSALVHTERTLRFSSF